ncbi:methylmalonyl Co-A mutase-associated GTPase MeaB, partial [Flavobacteriaceae bacterium]|nr:methylmalonyl Co-A mutase-associated GTPase MeaB [Flavobacteriaceae bacterium]
AKLAKVEFNRALHFYPAKASGWMPKVVLCSALENKGIDAAWSLICDYTNHANKEEYFTKKRQEQNTFWLLQSIENQLKDQFFQDETIAKELQIQQGLIADNKRSPFAAAEYLLNLHKKRS